VKYHVQISGDSYCRQSICTWYSCTNINKIRCVVNHAKFFKALGRRVKQLREVHGWSQEDMLSFGFSARHWQQIEAGRPITMTTALRICDAFKTNLEDIVRDLDRDIYRN
jgi:DNA-binding XRE family transcriptional regulator